MNTVKKIAIGIGVGLLAIVLVVAISFIAFVNLLKSGSMPGVNPISREGSQRVIVIEEELKLELLTELMRMRGSWLTTS